MRGVRSDPERRNDGRDGPNNHDVTDHVESSVREKTCEAKGETHADCNRGERINTYLRRPPAGDSSDSTRLSESAVWYSLAPDAPTGHHLITGWPGDAHGLVNENGDLRGMNEVDYFPERNQAPSRSNYQGATTGQWNWTRHQRVLFTWKTETPRRNSILLGLATIAGTHVQ